MIDGRLDTRAEQGSGLAIRQAGSQSHRLAGDPRAGVLTRRKVEESVERTDIPAGWIAHLPTAEACPAEARQQIQGALLDPPESGALGLEIACLQRLLAAGPLDGPANLGSTVYKVIPSGHIQTLTVVSTAGMVGSPPALAGPGPR